MKEKIISKQLFVLMFLSAFSFVSTLSSDALGDNIWDSILSVFIAFGLNIALSIPIFLLFKKENTVPEKIAESIYFKPLALFYLLFFVLSNSIEITQLENLFINTIFPDAPPIILASLLLLASVYGAIKGVEAVARASYFVFVFALIGLVLIVLGSFYLIDIDKREVFFYNGTDDMLWNTVVIFSRISTLPQLAILIFCVKDKAKITGFFTSQICVATACALIFVILVLCMGRFASTQIYPIYTLFTVAKLKPLERLDSIFSFVWLMIFTLKLSVSFVAIKIFFDKKAVYISAVIMLFLSTSFVGISVLPTSYIQLFLIIPSLILGFFVPLYYLRKGKK
ncbi:MAG: GerAB/ArcD/ProY family transporter [Clostridia bacterium]